MPSIYLTARAEEKVSGGASAATEAGGLCVCKLIQTIVRIRNNAPMPVKVLLLTDRTKACEFVVTGKYACAIVFVCLARASIEWDPSF